MRANETPPAFLPAASRLAKGRRGDSAYRLCARQAAARPARASRRRRRRFVHACALLQSRAQSPKVASSTSVRPTSWKARKVPSPWTRAVSSMSCTNRDRLKMLGRHCNVPILRGQESSTCWLSRRAAEITPHATGRQKLQSSHLATDDGAYLRMIAEGCSNAGSIFNNLVVLHPDIELLDFGNAKIFQMCRRLFKS